MKALSKIELNMAIAKAHTPNQCESWYKGFIGAGHANYCDDWNCLMPLVVEYKMVFEWSGLRDTWYAKAWNYNFLVFNDNPQRALAECLLKTLESKNNAQ